MHSSPHPVTPPAAHGQSRHAPIFLQAASPWQRGADVNGNGFLRQYFPKGISFHKITEKMVSDAAEQLNNRPRKCLHYQTPAEVFNQALTSAFAI